MGLDTLTVNLAGVQLRFACDFPPLAAYARIHTESLAHERPAGAADVEVELYWHEGLPPRDRSAVPASADRVDRDLYVDSGRLWWFRVDDLRDLRLAFEWDGQRLRVRGDYYFHAGNSERSSRLRQWLRPQQVEEQRRRRFTTLVYYLVYYPCWWFSEVRRSAHPIHAGAVNGPKGTILLAGGSGIGKSTLTVLLASQAGHQFLADSFVLHRQRKVHGVREPLLIDAPARQWLGGATSILDPIEWSYLLSRQGFHVRREKLAEGGDACALFLPRRAASPYLRPIPATRAAALTSAGDLIINDLRRYWAFAAALEYLEPKGLMALRESATLALAESIPCFELGLAMDEPPDAVVKRIFAAVEGSR